MSADIGVPAPKGALLVGLLTMSQTVGKIVAGNSMDRPGVNRLIMAQLSILVSAVATCLLPLATSYSALVAYVIVAGLMDGLFVIAFGLVTRDILGQKLLSKGIGLLYGFTAVPFTIGAPIAGLIYDDVGSYNPVFFLSSGLMTLGVCLMFLIPWSHLLSRQKLEMKKPITSSFANSLNIPPLSSTKEPKYKNLENSFVAEHIPTQFMDNERNHLLELECGHTTASRPSSVILFGIVTALSNDDQMLSNDGAEQFQLNEDALTGKLSNAVTHHTSDAATQTCLANTARVKVDFHPPNSWKTGVFSLADKPSDLPTIPNNMLITKPSTPVSSHAYYDNPSPKPTAPKTDTLNSGISDESRDSDRVSWNSEASEISWKTMSQDSADSTDSGYVEDTFPCFSGNESCSNDKIDVDGNVYTYFLVASNTCAKSDYGDSSFCTRDDNPKDSISNGRDTFYSNVPLAWSISKSEIHNDVTYDVKEDVFKSSTDWNHDTHSFDCYSQLAEDILERNVTPQCLEDDNFYTCEVDKTSAMRQNEGDILKEKEISTNVTENGESLLHWKALSFNPKPSDLFSYRVDEALESYNEFSAQVGNFSPTSLVMHCYRKDVMETDV